MYSVEYLGVPLNQLPGRFYAKMKKLKLDEWTITDVPSGYNEVYVKEYINNFFKGLTALEVPTSLFCNLRCKYCYIEDPRLKNKKVDFKIIEKIVIESPSLLKGTSERKEVYLSPWGAEPFCEIDNMRILLETALNVYPNHKINFSTSTNGTILNKKVDDFFKFVLNHERIKFNGIQVSLDGPKSVQDKQRYFANKKGSYDAVVNFIRYLRDNKINYHYSSTIQFDTPEQYIHDWLECFYYFGDRQNEFYSFHLPMRIAWHLLDTKEKQNAFVYVQKKIYEEVRKQIETNEYRYVAIDFYTGKLFLQQNLKCMNSFPFCSAMNTQVAVDLDGSIYLCHGPITNPDMKPYLCLGNLFTKEFSFMSLMRSMHFQYPMWKRVICNDCDLVKYCIGSLCWECAPNNFEVHKNCNISNFDKCDVYRECLKYWASLFIMLYDYEELKNTLPTTYNYLNKIREEMDLPRAKKLIPYSIKNCTFDDSFNNINVSLFKKYAQIKRTDIKLNLQIDDTWYKFSMSGDFIKTVQNKEGKQC